MNMKILILNGSPHRDGATSDIEWNLYEQSASTHAILHSFSRS